MKGMREGGCQCGRVRYAIITDRAETYLCHCRMCRRATGGASIAFVGLPAGDIVWHSEPDLYRSSPIAERPFCRDCGTPLGFRFVVGAETVDVTLGSLDDPVGFAPVRNYAIESVLPGWQDCSHLPTMRSDDNPSVTERWIEAVGKLPD